MTHTENAVECFFRAYERNINSGDMEALVSQFADLFFALGPRGAQSVRASDFAVADPRAFARQATERLFDHGLESFIISVHLVKTLGAGLSLAKACPDAAPTIHAALNRFLSARYKRRHVLRTARQMRAFVALE